MTGELNTIVDNIKVLIKIFSKEQDMETLKDTESINKGIVFDRQLVVLYFNVINGNQINTLSLLEVYAL